MAGNIVELNFVNGEKLEDGVGLCVGSVEGRKTVIVTDKYRSEERLVTAGSLEECIKIGKNLLGICEDQDVYAVLEDDGTEVDEEEYFQMLPEKSLLMVLAGEEIWSPNFSLQGSCIFDSATNVFTTGQLTAALMEHIQKVTLEMKTESKKGESQSF